MAMHGALLTCVMVFMAMPGGAHGLKQKVPLVRSEVVRVDADTKVDCSKKADDQCDAAADVCTWAGSACKAGCPTFSDEASCPEYCFWILQHTLTSREPSKKCLAVIGGMNIGGTSSGHGYYGHPVMEQYNRPQFKTSYRYDGQKWEPCGGTSNCFSSYGSRSVKAKLQETKYQIAAVEFPISCELDSNIVILYKKGWLKNANLRIFYNMEELTDKAEFKKTRWSSKYAIKVNSVTDKFPILRLEISRKVADLDAKAEFNVRLKNVRASFDQCMDVKATHGQCLEQFAKNGGTSELRSDHKKQLGCLDGTETSTDGCAEWDGCMGDSAKKLIMTVIKAFDQPALQLIELQQNLAPTNCKSGGHGLCMDPSHMDVEAFDCECFVWLEGKSEEEINVGICAHPDVCCDWKTNHCANADSLIQSTMTLRSTNKRANQNHSVVHNAAMKQRTEVSTHVANNDGLGDGLDGTMQGKCAAQ